MEEYRVPFLLGRMAFRDEEKENQQLMDLVDTLAGYSVKMVVDRRYWMSQGSDTMLPQVLPLFLRHHEIPHLCFINKERPVGAFHDIRLQVKEGIMEIWGDLELDAEHPLTSGMLDALRYRSTHESLARSYFGNRLRLWEHFDQQLNAYVDPYRTPEKGRFFWPARHVWAGFILDIRNWL